MDIFVNWLTGDRVEYLKEEDGVIFYRKIDNKRLPVKVHSKPLYVWAQLYEPQKPEPCEA